MQQNLTIYLYFISISSSSIEVNYNYLFDEITNYKTARDDIVRSQQNTFRKQMPKYDSFNICVIILSVSHMSLICRRDNH